MKKIYGFITVLGFVQMFLQQDVSLSASDYLLFPFGLEAKLRRCWAASSASNIWGAGAQFKPCCRLNQEVSPIARD